VLGGIIYVLRPGPLAAAAGSRAWLRQPRDLLAVARDWQHAECGEQLHHRLLD
jgi:hypothetical protein